MNWFDRLVFTFFNTEVAARYLPDIVKGMGVTVALGLCVAATGLALGLLLAVLRTLHRPWLSLPIVAFVDILRALPPLVVIIVLFFAFPYIDLAMSSFTATWIALSLVLAAYAEESIWAGLLALPRGQLEAARSTGLTWWQSMRRVLLPQALRIAVPALTNRVISTTKNTALGSVVALNEVLNNAQSASSNAGNPTPLTLGAVAYLAIFLPVVLSARWLETRWRWKR
ncbi:amino acid ABC transporter membrane protein 1, PAAT family [Variovorax sp. CF079]|uniref:amino acid ABC transporter permease n=1 Tax=Variovorax sp. CF079 TaxID=1882774 RepID=UPI00088A8364|nr:amino acid ABC transporter permease [Variovorax sp. CF079]SDC51455.1 amino acid ABC transporter membrane protein 1, PAAT family [Variovorax sp. CF079]